MTCAGEAPRRWKFTRSSVIPGFGLTFGVTLIYLTLIILIPLTASIVRSLSLGPEELWRIAVDKRTVNALRLSFGGSFVAAVINIFFGTVVAWVLTRYRFPGRRILDAIVDLPFALPTAVAGIALAALYAPNGWIGAFFAKFDIKIAFTRAGVIVALVFIGLPFVVRTLQPVIEEIDNEVEEVAATLGANRAQTVLHIILPSLTPALLTGFALAFARSVGEYGSVIFIAGNIPYISEIAPLLIVIKLEEFNYAAATGVATVMLGISFSMLLFINAIQAWSRRRFGDVA